MASRANFGVAGAEGGPVTLTISVPIIIVIWNILLLEGSF